jgi:hypothetical protein
MWSSRGRVSQPAREWSGARRAWLVALCGAGFYAALTAAAAEADAQTAGEATSPTLEAAEILSEPASQSAEREEARSAAAGAVRSTAEATGSRVGATIPVPDIAVPEIGVPDSTVPTADTVVAAAREELDAIGFEFPSPTDLIAGPPETSAAAEPPPAELAPPDMPGAAGSQAPPTPSPNTTDAISATAEDFTAGSPADLSAMIGGAAASLEEGVAVGLTGASPVPSRAGLVATPASSTSVKDRHGAVPERGDGPERPINHLPPGGSTPPSSPGPTGQSSAPQLLIADLTSVGDRAPSGWTAVQRWAHTPGVQPGALSEPTFCPD